MRITPVYRARTVHPTLLSRLRRELRLLPSTWNRERFMATPSDATVHVLHWFCGRGGSVAPYIQYAHLFGAYCVNVTFLVFYVDNDSTLTNLIDPLAELKHGIVLPNGCTVRAETHVIKERAARTDARAVKKVMSALCRLMNRLRIELRLDQVMSIIYVAHSCDLSPLIIATDSNSS